MTVQSQTPSSNCGATLTSAHSPPVRKNDTGLPSASTCACSLEVKPPRLRTRACLCCPLLRQPNVCGHGCMYHQSSPLRDRGQTPERERLLSRILLSANAESGNTRHSMTHTLPARPSQGAPVRSNQMIAFMNVRLSLAGRPPLGEPSSGRTGSSRCQVSSEMSVSTCPKTTRIKPGYKVCKHTLEGEVSRWGVLINAL